MQEIGRHIAGSGGSGDAVFGLGAGVCRVGGGGDAQNLGLIVIELHHVDGFAGVIKGVADDGIIAGVGGLVGAVEAVLFHICLLYTSELPTN